MPKPDAHPLRRRGALAADAAPLRLGAIRPSGWLAGFLRRELEEGITGCLDRLAPDLIIGDDIYGADRLTGRVRRKDLGDAATDPALTPQRLWWNSESQSNWWDGLIHAALLSGHPEFTDKARRHVRRMLRCQDDDGYMGIYAPDRRFDHAGENGELWAQASLMRGLLAFYEATGEEQVLRAVQRAVRVTMRAWPAGGRNPFAAPGATCGPQHGLMLTDVLDRLAQLTGQAAYARYARWLYTAYCSGATEQIDIVYANLVNPEYPFQGHGVHTYEHLRALIAAASAGGEPELENALEGYIRKLEPCLAPSGGPIGDEEILGRHAGADGPAYEYCSIHELLHSYCRLMQKTGDPAWGDRIEWLLFNAGQGARHPSRPAVAYLKTDNSLLMTGKRRPEDPDDPVNPQRRYKYSPAHRDMAVCCAANACRIYPYYIRAMWMRTPGGLLAALYGPSVLETRVGDVAIRITQETEYPFGMHLRFGLELAGPASFELAFRKPGWADGFDLDAGGARVAEETGLIRLSKTWRDGDSLYLRWQARIATRPGAGRRFTVSHGPLLYALPLAHRGRSVRAYPLAGFEDRHYRAAKPVPPGRFLRPDSLSLRQGSFDSGRPWESAPAIRGELSASQSHPPRAVELVPMGRTILRVVDFERGEAPGPV